MERTLDIIIPVFNEAAALPSLFQELEKSFSPVALKASSLTSVRFLFIDDGSSDDTTVIIADRIKQGMPATLVCLSRNFGHQAAVAAGLDQSTGDFVAIIDADLQDPPALIHDMIARMASGFDIVYGVRQNRKESILKRFLYSGFYRLCSLLSEVHFPVDAGDFCVMNRDVVLALRELPEKLRFQRGLRSWIGFRQSPFMYDRPARLMGDTKYTAAKLYTLATDGIASLSIRPLRITQVLLFLSVIVTLFFIGLATVFYIRTTPVNSNFWWFILTQCLIAGMSSMQLFCLYIFSAYLGRMYMEVKSRPSYVIMRTVGPPSASR